MNKKYQRRGIVLTEASIIKEKKETASPTITTKKFTHELISRGIKKRCNQYYNPPLTSRNARQVVVEPRVSRLEFANSRENSVSFAEPRIPRKRFFFLPTAGKPRKVHLKKPTKGIKNHKEVKAIDMAQTILRDSVNPIELSSIEFKPGSAETLEESEETPKFKYKEETELKDCMSRKEIVKSSFTSAFDSVQNLHPMGGSEMKPKVNFRRRSRLLKASIKKAQCQKVQPPKEPNPSPILTHRRSKITPLPIQIERKEKQQRDLSPFNIPWNKNTYSPCNLTFGEDL